ncbi:aminoglycoside phosphotransferase family protein [Kribbella turkmenica]|uniref:Aminoglycoside phosphotransferase family protein n=1 Tax=Kribbella turkmenica TaxID=2530375 RepID=A0A4R4X7J3_9ACTN|nr:aminoglycoside phosphotransferase family protein [Kribbella turkmenica]
MTEGEVRRLVGIGLPGYDVRRVVRLGAGLDNVAFAVNDELVVRIAREPGSVSREEALLGRVGEVSPLPVPAPVFALAEHDCLAYRKLTGTPLIDIPIADRTTHAVTIGAELGAFLAVLHRSDPGRWTGLVDRDEEPLADWRDEAAEQYADVGQALPPANHRAVEEFLLRPLPDPAPELVFSHNDLGIEHVLVAPGTEKITGVIDWSDAARCDPARDFGLILRDLGPAAFDAALDRYPAGDELRERAWFYARCSLLEDLRFGLETGRTPYLDKSLAAVDWLFTPN